MTTASLEQVAELLREVGTRGTFTAQKTASADDLSLEVRGLGLLKLPVSRTQAQQLCRIARPARYGLGEQTLLDRRVRDTWEVPKSRVRIDGRRWNRTLLPTLEALRADLGLPEGCRLKAKLHSMLVYEKGQFFLPHKDSEKADSMVGTLAVTLPALFKGGAIVVEHQGEKVTYRGSKQRLSFVAFYADCQHEVRPVKEGYRVVLTYNLMLDVKGAADRISAIETPAATVDALAERLREHFETPLPPRYSWEKDAPLREPPSRLVYLLDHEYTERGLGWNQLKSSDASRAAALLAAADRYGCESVLALAEIHEAWSCMEPGWDEPRRGRHKSWGRDEDEEWYAEEGPSADDPDAYELIDLVNREILLNHWIDASGKKAASIVTSVEADELCFTTPSTELEAYASEYEGYMGNYGNTMDRWYRRAAIVLWPFAQGFAVRAEASPTWALDELKQRLRTGTLPQAREMAASVLRFWKGVGNRDDRRALFKKVLRVAEGLEDAELAASLLKPFHLDLLEPRQASAWVALGRRYGEDWLRSLLSEWSGSNDSRWYLEGSDPVVWAASMPQLCEALRAKDRDLGIVAGRLLVQDRWNWARLEIDKPLRFESPSLRTKVLAKLEGAMLGLLESAAIVEASELRDELAAYLCSDGRELLVPNLVGVLREAVARVDPKRQVAMGLENIRQHCIGSLEARLEKPARAEGDWSIPFPERCSCELCATLGEFLSSPSQERLEWPIAKQRRAHVHGRIGAHELPVRHETRRTGSPYTLVLTKLETLFESEARERQAWQADLEWLTGQADTRSPKRAPRAVRRKKR